MGEDAAVDYLMGNGYEILERNWRYSRAEIDIIARNEFAIIVVEVKSRLSDDFVDPVATVSQQQMRRLTDAYAHYADRIKYMGECRFDIIGVVFVDPEFPEITHYEDAFFPG